MIAVLTMAHGTPERLDQMEAYLTLVRGGRAPSAELVEEMTRNVAAIGGRSPLTDITRLQARVLEETLGPPFRVFVGMRNWHPFIADAAREAIAAGAQKIVGLPMAPQYSSLSVGKYLSVLREVVPPEVPLVLIRAWYDHPGVLEAFSENVKKAIVSHGSFDRVVFTAHSLPERVADVEEQGMPSYTAQVRKTAEGVASRLGLERWQIAYQSAGRTPEPWLGPSLREALTEISLRGEERVLAVPVGFVCDHTEILFDIDIDAQGYAKEQGIRLFRTESLNSSPVFIRALADIVACHLQS